MAAHCDDSVEEIFKDAVSLLGGTQFPDNEIIQYGPLTFTVAPKEGKANTLLADQLFSPALLLAEKIELNLLNAHKKTVLELGAGSALPSLLLATRPLAPSLVVATDYPDEGIPSNLRHNIERNAALVDSSCRLEWQGYEWGSNIDHIRITLQDHDPIASGFDLVILSDLLHFDTSHDDLVKSIHLLLSKSPASRVHIAAGVYTHINICNRFLQIATQSGLSFVEQTSADTRWLGKLSVSHLDEIALATRKSACRYWVGRWREFHEGS